jgi:hypothetical protein
LKLPDAKLVDTGVFISPETWLVSELNALDALSVNPETVLDIFPPSPETDELDDWPVIDLEFAPENNVGIFISGKILETVVFVEGVPPFINVLAINPPKIIPIKNIYPAKSLNSILGYS